MDGCMDRDTAWPGGRKGCTPAEKTLKVSTRILTKASRLRGVCVRWCGTFVSLVRGELPSSHLLQDRHQR